MSESSRRQIQRMLDDTDDGALPFNQVHESVMRQQSVKPNTAKTYIRKNFEVEEDVESGQKMVVDPERSSTDTGVLFTSGEVLNREVGEPTGEEFYHLPVLEDNGHPLIPEHAENNYFERQLGNTNVKDTEVVTHSIVDPDFATIGVGEAGTGKDHCLEHICANANRAYIDVNFSSEGDFMSMLFGHYSPTEDGHFVFKKGLLALAVENGWHFNAQELNVAPGEIQVALNGLLGKEESRKLVIPGANEVIEPHPQFTFSGTMNPPELGYGGTKELNDAFKDRFDVIRFDYLDKKREKMVIIQNSPLTEDDDRILENIIDMAQKLRNMRRDHRFDSVVTPRVLIRIARKTEIMDAKEATKFVLESLCKNEDRDAVSKAISQTW